MSRREGRPTMDMMTKTEKAHACSVDVKVA
jgi:hypothetical protein